ncbi:MAG TPA: threonine ammonia-lyase, partial [Alphaproteobacteria bacterium]|nr:threonine ammonia-lyase [Alphaproteobacteria bacterium]
MTVTLDHVQAAAKAIADDLPRTPLVPAPALSQQAGCTLWLKLENLHRTGSFKERGALNTLRSLSAEEQRRGVIAMSAGNHAQGVAYHATRLGIPSTIVMPVGTPFVKQARTEGYGAKVVLHGANLAESEVHAREVAARDGLTLVHPYDDERIIAGQGTIALEMLAEVPGLDTLVVPIGGGGLIAGIALAAKALKPGIEVIGVETELYPSMFCALRGEPDRCGGATVAEGIAVKNAGQITRELVRRHVDDIQLVSEGALERAIFALATASRTVAEGAGAAGLALVLDRPERFAGRQVGVVVCGGNIDPRMLASILMRGLVHEGRIARLRIAITDEPGTLGRIAAAIGEAGGNIVEVTHQRLLYNVPVKMADVDVVVETRDLAHVQAIAAKLEERGFPTELM